MLQRLGRFEILRLLGKGAMGEVYLGRDPAIGREVALKTIRGEAAQGSEARERFAREAQAAGTLNHPNLVTIHEFGEDQGVLYLAMEMVPGVDLEALFRDRVLAPVEVLEILAQVCDGLAYAHQKGVLHRDIKPSNIRVRREGDAFKVKVMDFGIAHLAGSDLTDTGILLGTFCYMAPEYIKSGVPEVRSDLFAVGVMLYEALAGRRPFEGDTTGTVLYRIVNEEPQSFPVAYLRGISPQVEFLVRKALAKDPAHRFQDAEALARALRAAKDPDWVGLPGGQPTRPGKRLPAPASPGPARKPRNLVWAAALILLASAGSWSLYRYLHPTPLVIRMPPGNQAGPPSSSPLQVNQEADPPEAPRGKGRAGRVAAQPPASLSLEATRHLLDQAASGLLDQPQGALTLCDRVLKDQPSNTRAYALKTVALYDLGRYDRMPQVLEAAQAHGVEPRHCLTCAAFRDMLREERRDQRLPANVRVILFSEVPGPARRLPGAGGRWN